MSARQMNDHEGLQVVVGDGPEHVPYSDKQAVLAETVSESVNKHEHQWHGRRPAGWDGAEQSRRNRYCGLSKPLCLGLAAILIALVVGAGIGGGVAASLGGKHSSSSDAKSLTVSISSASETTSQDAQFRPTTSPYYSNYLSPTSSNPPARLTSTSTISLATSSPTSNSPPAPASSTPSSTSTSTTSYTSTTSSPSATQTSGMGSYDCPAANDTTYTSGSTTFLKLCNVDWPSGTIAVDGVSTVTDLDTGIIATSLDSCIDECVAAQGCTAVAYGANITLALSRSGITGNCFLKNQRGLDDLADNSGQEESAYMIS